MMSLMAPDDIVGVVTDLDYGDQIKLYQNGCVLEVVSIHESETVDLQYSGSKSARDRPDIRLRVRDDGIVQSRVRVRGVGWAEDWDTVTWLTEVGA